MKREGSFGNVIAKHPHVLLRDVMKMLAKCEDERAIPPLKGDSDRQTKVQPDAGGCSDGLAFLSFEAPGIMAGIPRPRWRSAPFEGGLRAVQPLNNLVAKLLLHRRFMTNLTENPS